MAPSYGRTLPNTYVFLRLPSDIVKLIELKPNTIIEVGKYGTFSSNLLIGRPYYTTFEILDKREGEAHVRLRYVPAKELNAEVVAEYDAEVKDGDVGSETVDLDEERVAAVEKDNRLTMDNATRQNLSHLEIEELKQTASGREIIDTIMANHNALDEKTAYSKAKYSLRKAKKYLKRFTVLPMEIGTLQDYVREKEPGRILEMREESLALITAWSNAHFSEALTGASADAQSGRWLAVDDSGGLIVAALAERMGILRKDEAEANVVSGSQDGDHSMPDAPAPTEDGPSHRDFPLPAASNTITNLHSMVQQNVSLLKFFGYDSNTPDTDHPLHDRLLPISWLQLLHPDQDPTYREPEVVNEGTLQTYKSGKKGTYYKKRRRWARCKAIVDNARAGGFEGLVMASHMDPANTLAHLIPLIRGGGHVVIYSPVIEPLVSLMDLYSRERRAAYISALSQRPDEVPSTEDFPLDPRLLLAPTLQTSRIREWQVLPGRTHPLMTSKGGSEGFVFTARRVIPLEGGVEARGNFGRKRKAPGDTGGTVGE
ncbi:hypothetical protein B0A48_10148 [Cryoendolithus antarcticus]|uniref:tRNA (adenine(58)-N(1))-methyltransferase non-catalytic subunit TRM6 n=1 Tax=Cryoendolithus antarcticus TaxID=1507870 RepID=A0A1V8SWN4_9PEZI|nr:hypothetical protein B0A48_10148 [Cryoendolithus antarcticus]